jgi:hypothetical protein
VDALCGPAVARQELAIIRRKIRDAEHSKNVMVKMKGRKSKG